jgi:uncharacterized protein (DUF58 family)
MLGHSAKSITINQRSSISLPVTLRWNQIRIRPTRNGFIFIFLVLSMLLGSINYINNLGFLLTFLLGSIAFVSIANTYKNIAGITIRSSFSRPLFAGGKAVFEFIIPGADANKAGVKFAFKNESSASYNLVGGTENHIQVFARAASRGILKPGPLSICSDYPLGLFRVVSQIDLNLECIVYPKPLPGKIKTRQEKSAVGEEIKFKGPGSDDFNGLKNYSPGDPLQRISWRASSRGQGLFTKAFDGHYGSTVYLDWHSIKVHDTEQRLSLLCHTVLKADQDGLIYGLKLPGSSIAPAKGRAHRNGWLKALALFNYKYGPKMNGQ